VPTATPRQDLIVAYICAAVVLALAAAYRPEYAPTSIKEPALQALRSHWAPVPGRVPARFVAGSIPDTLTAQTYQAPSGERVELFIGGITDTTPDGGLGYRSVTLPPDVTTSRVALQSTGVPLEVNRAVVRRGASDVEVLFWYDLNGSTTSYGRTAKAYASAHVLTNLGALPRLVVVVADRPRGEQRTDLLSEFVGDVSRALNAQEPELE